MSALPSTCCPKCQGKAVDRSQWRSHEEKRRHPGSRPVRCVDCGHRYLAPTPSGDFDILKGGVIAAGIVAALAVFAAVGLWLAPAGSKDTAELPAVSLTVTPAAMQAAEAGDVEAQFAVGSALLTNAETNLAYATKAVDFLRQAAERGHGRAMLRLGVIFKKGVDAPQNYGLAAQWIEKAALLGEPQAMLEFGRLYREGVGVPQDMVKAYIWLNRAAAARDPDAPRERGEVARLLTQNELRHAQDATLAVEPPANSR